MNNPFFSIIIPSLNSSRTIRRSLDSIIHQNFLDFEILIIDGNSIDDTISVINSYNDFRIKLFSGFDRGIYDAMNKGLQWAQGNWLYFMGSDDYLHDEFVLSDIQKFITSSRNKVVYGNVKVHGETGWANHGELYGGEFEFRKFYKSNICHQSIFYNRGFILENSIKYNLRFPICADWDFNFQCWNQTKFEYTSRVIAVFQAGGISSRNDIFEPFLKERKKYLPYHYRLREVIKKFYRQWIINI